MSTRLCKYIYRHWIRDKQGSRHLDLTDIFLSNLVRDDKAHGCRHLLRYIILDIVYDFWECAIWYIDMHICMSIYHIAHSQKSHTLLISVIHINNVSVLSRFFGCKWFLCVITDRNLAYTTNTSCRFYGKILATGCQRIYHNFNGRP